MILPFVSFESHAAEGAFKSSLCVRIVFVGYVCCFRIVCILSYILQKIALNTDDSWQKHNTARQLNSLFLIFLEPLHYVCVSWIYLHYLGLSFMKTIMLLIVQEDRYGNCHDAILYCFSFDCISSFRHLISLFIF